MYYVYILVSCKDNHFYIGFTKDLRERLKRHNKGLVKSTKNRRPFKLAYYEAYQDKRDALSREKFLKTGWGKNYIYRVLKHYLSSQKELR